MRDTLNRHITLRHALLDSIKAEKTIFKAIDLMIQTLGKGNKILVFGNGGSAAQSAHFAAEMVNKFYRKRRGLPAIDLTTNTANITSIANDYDFKTVFSKQIDALGEPGDLAMGLTTSGRSPNILEGLETAGKKKLKTLCLCGNHWESLKKLNVDTIIPVQSGDTPAIQEMHLFILHFMAETLESRFFGDQDI